MITENTCFRVLSFFVLFLIIEAGRSFFLACSAVTGCFLAVLVPVLVLDGEGVSISAGGRNGAGCL